MISAKEATTTKHILSILSLKVKWNFAYIQLFCVLLVFTSLSCLYKSTYRVVKILKKTADVVLLKRLSNLLMSTFREYLVNKKMG